MARALTETEEKIQLRCRKAFSWLTIEETEVIRHALENYAKLGPDNSWRVQLARDLLKDIH